MASLLVPCVPFYRNPQLKTGLDALLSLLMERNYSTEARWSIYDHASVHGTLEGSLIEPEDMADAEQVFVDALPAVALDSPAWDKEDVLLDAELLARDVHPWPLVGNDDGEWSDTGEYDTLEAIGMMPPISGGSPEALDGDRRDFEDWLSSLDRDYPPDDQVEPARDPFGSHASPCGSLD